METYQDKIHEIIKHIEKVMVGKRSIAVLSLTALLSNGHVLLEDVPGVGKTMLVRTLAKTLGCDFSRIQFTPDLLPSDVTGVNVYNPKTQQFEYRKGPIIGDIILADEINRTSPKTQSALLEAMEEGSVTVDGTTLSLEAPFFVMATQNPIEYEGTYPLPEAQLDRFLMKLNMGYPSYTDEMDLLDLTSGDHPIDALKPIVTKELVTKMQEDVTKIFVDRLIKRYIVDIVRLTREHASIRLGVSPRGAINLMKAAKAYAFIHDRDYVIPDDVIDLIPYVLPHRLILSERAEYEGQTAVKILDEITQKVDIPIRRD